MRFVGVSEYGCDGIYVDSEIFLVTGYGRSVSQSF